MTTPPSADGWNTFGIPRPDRGSYLARAKMYLDYIMPTSIAVIIAEYGSSLSFRINGDVSFDNIKYPPIPLSDECPVEFVRHIRILASIQLRDGIYDLLSDKTWRERYSRILIYLPTYVWSPGSNDEMKNMYPIDGYLSMHDHGIFMHKYIHSSFRWLSQLEFTAVTF